MAEHRMFTDKVIESDEFLELPVTAQNLYLHLNMHADDRGFVANPRTVMRICGATNGDAKALLDAKFILGFESKSVILIKHWRLHNLIRKDRMKETVYLELMSCIYLDENGSYTQNEMHAARPVLVADNQVTTNCQPSDNQMSAQDKISKDKLSKDNLSQGKERVLGETPAGDTPATPASSGETDKYLAEMDERRKQKFEFLTTTLTSDNPETQAMFDDLIETIMR